MLFFAFDNPPPYTILLISGYVDFAPALHKLGQRGYTIVLAIPSGVGVSRALSNAGQFVWYWRSIARGEGLVSAKSSLSRSFSSDDSNLSNDEEAVVHKGMPQNRYIVGTSSTQTCTINSTQIAPDLSRIQLAEPSANAVSYSDEGSFDETIALDMSRPRNRMQGRRGASRIWVARSRPSTSSDSETSYEGVEWGRYPDTGSHRGRASHPGMARAAQRSPPPFAALPLALVANSPERPVVSPGSAPPDLGKQPMQVDAGITSKDGEQKEDVEDPKDEH